MCGRFVTGADELTWSDYSRVLTLTTRVQRLEERDCYPGSMVQVVRWAVDEDNDWKHGKALDEGCGEWSAEPVERKRFARITERGKGDREDDCSDARDRELVQMKWGFIPSPPLRKQGVRLIFNLRADRLHETFPRLLGTQRCLIPAAGFYEWKKAADREKRKQGYLIGLTDCPLFSFAGVWRCSPARSAEKEKEFSLITTEPNDRIAPIHNRMPVVLVGEDANLWLDSGGEPEVFDELVKPYPHEMSIRPLDDEKTTPQLSLFKDV